MTLTLRNLPSYVLAATPTTVIARSLPVYVLVKEKTPLPKNIEVTQVIADAVSKLIVGETASVDITLGYPLPSGERENKNTSVDVHGFSGTHEGWKRFYYRRRELDEILMGVELPAIDLTGMTTTLDVIEWLSDQTGVLLTDRDIVDSPLAVEDGHITLTAKDGSYWFVPGTTVTIPSSEPT